MSKAVAMAMLVSAALGCQKQWYGAGQLYVWNGTLQAVTIDVQGRSPAKLTLFANSGELLDSRVAGPYVVRVATTGETLHAEVRKTKLTLVNLQAVGCFVRADVSGRYRRDRRPADVLELYRGQSVIAFESEIRVMPGQELPEQRPKTAYTFQRVATLDCSLIDDDKAVERYLMQLR